MTEQIYSAAQRLIESLCLKVSGSRAMRLNENAPYAGKVIMPKGFEHISSGPRAYFVWPNWTGRIGSLETAAEFVPKSDNYVYLCLEVRVRSNYNFWLYSGSKEDNLLRDVQSDSVSLSDKISSVYHAENCGAYPDFLNSEWFADAVSALPLFLRFRVSEHNLRLTLLADSPEALDSDRVWRCLESLLDLAADISKA